ncbi:hypothetical protein AMK16_06570 [Streptomyces sp. CB00455]|uniref:DUF397 domain-containing protein n=1 Tax=Streptomyces sp. CB00455 TaxID=1703927 RepID=UPI00093ECDE7|nr:DUF397 domain-containing protein [Streptomyces sp. CB00455]OKK22722.1 hypothetical protein AMK16_06570 [Streptomyces sp. CB00455]
MKTARTSTTASELTWRKSTYSGAEGGECLEVTTTPGAMYVRDSKQFGGPVLAVGPEAWTGFVRLAAGPRTY